VVNYRESRTGAEDVVRLIQAAGGTGFAMQADLASSAQARQLFDLAEEVAGPLSLVVNNAGAIRDRLLLQMSDADWEVTWDTNLTGARTLARAAMAAMCRRGAGRIINVSSVVGSVGNAGQANYAAAKSALLGLTRELALIGAPHNVTVNCVVPGYIVTDATAHLTSEQRESWISRIPMNRYATPEEVAELVVFLASSGAGYITGQCIAVDGGFMARVGAGISS
jgi:3-oxoacyl-[acyl-carrier protein] reductase